METLFRGKHDDEWFYGDLLRYADTAQILDRKTLKIFKYILTSC